MLFRTAARAVAVAVGVLGLPVIAAPATAHPDVPVTGPSTTVTVPYISRTRIDGVWTPIEGYTRDFTVTAPTTIAPWTAFAVKYDSAPLFPVAAFNKQVTDLKIAYKVSGNVTVLDHHLSGGSNLGGAQFWVERYGSTFVLRSNAVFQGGVQFDVPDLVLTLKSKGSGTVTTSPGGSSFDRPAFYWYREQTTSLQWDPFQNYVDPANPVTFTTTTIG